MSNTIVGIAGKARSGKDTVAKYLIEEYGFKSISFATALKEGLGRRVFGLTDDQLYGDKKEVVDEFWNKRLNIYEVSAVEIGNPDSFAETFISLEPYGKGTDLYGLNTPRSRTPWYVTKCARKEVTPRLLLQLGGTEAGRKIFGQHLWVEALFRYVKNSDHNKWVIPDVRFPNEAQAILDNSGVLIKVIRPGAKASGGVTLHASEVALDDWKDWTYEINNEGTIEYLFVIIDSIARKYEWK